MFEYLSYPPILRGAVALLISGALFPVIGVFVLRLNLITLRFMLMHGTLLGGAIALGFGINPLLIGVLVNLLLIVLIARLSAITGGDTGYITTFFMVLTIGLAFIVMYRMKVPAKDALSILWGNLLAMTRLDVALTVGFCGATLVFVLLFYGRLKAVVFSREIAFTSGVNDTLIYQAILVFIGFTIAFAMRLIGALLLDALLLLPAIVASFYARSTRGMFLIAGACGVIASTGGFVISLSFDIPTSSAVTVVAAILLAIGLVTKRTKRGTRA